MKTKLISRVLERRIEARENAAALFGRVCRDYDGWACWSGSEDCMMVHKKVGKRGGPETRFVRGSVAVVADERPA